MARLFIAAMVMLGGAAHVAAQEKERPNLVILLADDLRWDALGCMGNQVVRTPNLDALARRGVLFRNAFVTTSICSVSRASIFSGQYARRHKINDFQTAFTPEAWTMTYPALLRAAGYRTGFIGKFGVGNRMPTKAFDYWKGFPGQGQYFGKGETVHINRRMGDQMLEFLKGCDGKTPFCLSVSFKCPHAQDRAPREFPPDPQDEGLYKDAVIPVPRTADERFFQALPAFAQKSEGRARWKLRFDTPEKFQAIVKDYYRLVTGMDREIGRLVAELERAGLLDNTVIVFTSDNGFFFGERGMADKWLMYEESIRVPLIVADPRQPQDRRGRGETAMALNIDVAPTLLDFAGVKAPEAMQGKSLRTLLGGAGPKWREDWFYEHHTLPKIIPPTEGVRTTRWAYLRWMSADPPLEELYDIQADPRQERNVVAEPGHRRALEHLRGRWQELRRELK